MVAPWDGVHYHYGDVVSQSKQEALAVIDASGVRAGQRYQHWKMGDRYTVVSVGLVEATLEPTVGYAGRDGIVWYRPLAQWLERVAFGAPRFALITDGEPVAETRPPPGHPMMSHQRGGRFL